MLFCSGLQSSTCCACVFWGPTWLRTTWQHGCVGVHACRLTVCLITIESCRSGLTAFVAVAGAAGWGRTGIVFCIVLIAAGLWARCGRCKAGEGEDLWRSGLTSWARLGGRPKQSLHAVHAPLLSGSHVACCHGLSCNSVARAAVSCRLQGGCFGCCISAHCR